MEHNINLSQRERVKIWQELCNFSLSLNQRKNILEELHRQHLKDMQRILTQFKKEWKK